MKKIAFITVLCLMLNMFVNYFAVNSHASEDDAPLDRLTNSAHFMYLEEALSSTRTLYPYTTNYNTFLAAYYDNLTYNFGVNYKQSCGYIAIAMLLSYYDTYLIDSIIPEQYDVCSIGTETNMIDRANSPGVMRDFVENVNDIDDALLRSMSAIEYYSIMSSISDRSLHAKLLTLGAARGYYDFSNDLAPALITFEELLQTLIDYLSNVALIEENMYEIYSINRVDCYNSADEKAASNEVKEFTVEHIQAGRPVVLVIYTPGEGSHAVIAYDYIESVNSVQCHMGYGANQTNIPIEARSKEVYFVSALAIDFDMEHSHSYNYGVTTIIDNSPQTKYYCYDNCTITTYMEKEHTFTFGYEQHSTTQHKAHCECGEFIYQSHILSDNLCTLCGATHTHEYNQWMFYSNRYHIEKCECGEVGTLKKVHAVSASDIGRYKQCISCGGTVDTFSDFNQIQSIESMVTLNGSYILPNGIIVLVDGDIENYLNDTLKFYCPNDNLEDR